MNHALKERADFPRTALRPRLRVVVQHFEEACEWLDCGDISGGKHRIERTLQELRDLVDDAIRVLP